MRRGWVAPIESRVAFNLRSEPLTNARIAWIAVTAAIAACAGPCGAQEKSPASGWYVAPMIQGVRTDADRKVGDNAAFTLAVGAEVDPAWNLELNLFRGRFDGDSGDDLDLDAAGLDILRVFRRDARLAPYLLAGLGAQRNHRNFSDSETNLYEEVGLGILGTLRRSATNGSALFLRADARARHDDTDAGSRIDYLFGIGLQYSFGSSRPARQATLPAPAPAPAAAPRPVVADTDGDGVRDDLDRCAGTPPGRAVGAEGCELDEDGDGIVDGVDRCAHTPRGARIDAAGCEIKNEIRLPFVTFEYDSDRLEAGSAATLDQAVETLRRNSDLRIEVAGYTDDRGPESYNRALSQRRADAVRRYLADHGVTNVLTARGYGESDPIADNGTDAGRAENRRVVLRILER